MGQLDRETERAIAEAARLVSDNQNGGRHRLEGSIGAGSARIKRFSLIQKAMFFGASVFAIFLAATVAGLVLDGIGFAGIMLVIGALILAAVMSVSLVGKIEIPKRDELKKGEPKQMVARTELWLEAQRPALPAPAVQVVDQIGVQLDALGLQLETVDQSHPSVAEVRELVGEYIPETIDNYRKIPAHLRAEQHVGKSADDRLTDSLGKISGEIDRVTRRLAEGALDDLAIKDRYLEYRYGGEEALSDASNSGKDA